MLRRRRICPELGQHVDDLALRDPLSRAIIQPRRPRSLSVEKTLNEVAAKDSGTVDRDEVCISEALAHLSHRHVDHPAVVGRVQAYVVTFGCDFVDQ